jgi:hypothetical protein
MTNSSLKCFVARAFGHEDVDRIYDKSICPVLRELGCAPLRVDRVEHNEDIDDKLFALLDSSDFCIADLTYARPSVYYEAGYAHSSGRPVVYIARRDHFRRCEDDSHGNRVVHFDLQMKNIIPWTEPNANFKEKLLRRIHHAVRPLLSSRKHEMAQAVETQQFRSMSQMDQQKSLVEKARRMLYAHGFKNIDGGDHDSRLASLCRVVGSNVQGVTILARPSVSKANLVKNLFWLRITDRYGNPDLRQKAKDARAAEWFLIIASLHSVSDSVLSNAFPFDTSFGNKVMRTTVTHGKAKRTNTIAVIDSVKNISSFSERFQDLCHRLELV